MPPRGQDFYDDEIQNGIAKLPTEDHLGLLRSLFNSMVNSMRAYYHLRGLTQADADSLIENEVLGVKELIRHRLIEIETESPKPLDNPSLEPRATEPTDDQFENDCAIDLHFLMEKVSKRK